MRMLLAAPPCNLNINLPLGITEKEVDEPPEV